MKYANVALKSITPLQFSKHYSTQSVPKLNKESAEDYERRTWRNRAHRNDKGKVIIPPSFFKKSLDDAAKFLSIKIPGKGQATWTKHFTAGVLVLDPLTLNIDVEKIEPLELFVPSDGKRGGGKRVTKLFPVVTSWDGVVQYAILDDSITQDVFRQHVETAGSLIGIGAYRPINGGTFGRYEVKSIEWTDARE